MTAEAVDIVANIDAYGTKGRATCLADYMEYEALAGRPMRLSLLADLSIDRGWGRRDLDLVRSSASFADWEEQVTTELPKFEDDGADIVARVGQILTYRQTHLSDMYPFAVEGEGSSTTLRVKEQPFHDGVLGYLSLLAFTLAHSFSIKVPGLSALSVEDAFEDFVAETFNRYGLPASVIPTYEDKLEKKIATVAEPLGLRPQVSHASFSKRAKDGGTDIVCHIPTADSRLYPCFLFLGQATCGQTETWEAKAAQVSLRAWRKMLLMEYDPVGFLAVPHHVDPRHWALLVQDCGTPVVDRIRLLSMAAHYTPDGQQAANHLFGLSAPAELTPAVEKAQ